MLLLVRRFRSGISNGAIFRLLEKGDKKIKAMQKQALLVRVANNSIDVGELVSSCQAIKDGLDKFYISSSFLFKLQLH